ncbi:uncharacterized protein LOC141720132 [Apium graveolens]|uniref:uncharacterized protein LOC141720132 n=1 Tax=Apium graveolens TaxID=4045 RepID=UPI003D78BB7A
MGRLESATSSDQTEYLIRPNEQDVSRLLAENEQRGFPGMLCSIDYMHWKWKNCPTAWQGSLNDINVLDRPHLFEDLDEGRRPEVKYTINGNEYNMGYYFGDGNKRKYFIAAQKSIKKDVERAFDVLQSRFVIIRDLSRFWDVETMKYIMTACVILHNMIIEDERESSLEEEHFDSDVEVSVVTRIPNHPNNLREFIQVHQQIRNKPAHFQLQNDLIEHPWQIHGGDMN